MGTVDEFPGLVGVIARGIRHQPGRCVGAGGLFSHLSSFASRLFFVIDLGTTRPTCSFPPRVPAGTGLFPLPASQPILRTFDQAADPTDRTTLTA